VGRIRLGWLGRHFVFGLACGEEMKMLSQFYQYPIAYQSPYFTPTTPVAYQESYANYELYPTQQVGYNEWDQYSHFLLQPIDQSYMPDTPIPGFQGLGALSDIPVGVLAIGAIALLFFWKKKK
jgi:hypothetical protein